METISSKDFISPKDFKIGDLMLLNNVPHLIGKIDEDIVYFYTLNTRNNLYRVQVYKYNMNGTYFISGNFDLIVKKLLKKSWENIDTENESYHWFDDTIEYILKNWEQILIDDKLVNLI